MAGRSAKSVVTIGAFDGIHMGHRRILDEVALLARGLRVRGVVITFEPHPISVFTPDEAPMMLTTLAEKLALIEEMGLDETVVLRFTSNFARRRAEWFVRNVLMAKFNMARLVIGYDFRFGKGREGDAQYLEALGENMGFGVDIVPPVKFGAHPVSSTRVRTSLARGDVKSASKMLGRSYSLAGWVVRGEGRGRLLTYPTANLEIGDATKMLPRLGIYAVRVMVGKALYPGVLYIGTKPTYGGEATTIEVHLIGFEAGLYGQEIEVHFVDRIRDEREFKDDKALKRAIAADVTRARSLLEN